jgi:flagellin
MTRINTNVPSLIAQNRLNRSNEDLQTALTRLSTGLRINSGKDDPAGLIASESLRSDITGINKAISNTQRASQIIATADSALGEVSSLLNDIRGLVVEAANNGALSDDEIAANQLQVDSSLEAINRIAQTTTFQGRRLLDGSLDFITKGGAGFGTVSDLKIDQANLGDTGSIAVDVAISKAATRASISSTGIPTATTAIKSSGTVTFGSPDPAGEAVLDVALDKAFTVGDSASADIAIATTIADGEASGSISFGNGYSFDVAVRDGAIPDGELGNGITVNISTSNVATTSSGTYDANTNTLNLTLVEGQSADATVTDLANDAAINQIFDFSNGTATTQATGTVTLGASAIEVTVTAIAGEAADGAIGNDVIVRTFRSGNAGTDPTTATYDENTNTLDIYLADGLNAAALEAALGGTAAATTFDFTAANGTTTAAGDAGASSTPLATGTFGNVATNFAGPRTGEFSGGSDTTADANITLTAVDGGAADGAVGNNTEIIFTSGGAAGTASANYDAANNALTITVGAGATIQNIADAIDADGTFTAGSYAPDAAGVYDTSDNGSFGTLSGGGGNISNYSAGTSPIAAGNFRLTAVNGGAADGTVGNTTTLNFTTGASTAASYDADANVLNITVGADATVQDVVDAINTDNTFLADNVLNGTSFFNRNADPTGDIESNTPTVLTLGTDGTLNDVITVTADDPTADKDGITITLTADNSLAAGQATATVGNDGNITVNVSSNGPVAIGTIASKINDLDGFGATVTTNDGDGSYDIVNDTAAATTALSGGQFGGGLNADLVVQLSGASGSEVLQFNKGASLSNVIQSINLVSDATGVVASDNAGALKLDSAIYGSDALVAVEVISEGTGGTFKSGLTASRANGSDIEATVNGTKASGKGNTLSINTATLDLNLTVAEGSSDSVKFDITGGGALFQLGPDVVSNQQARLGIGSLNTAKLGGASGRLYELASGGSKSLTSDISGAAEVVDEVINKVTNLRGRLGAFQATTLESNLVSLNDTVANLQQAESSIRDADFAAESAKLTRAQILVQSGTNVLALANQNPQNVLSLLR